MKDKEREMPDEFYTQKHCDRCGAELKYGRQMSRFNTDCLCLECINEERQHPDYKKALDAERRAVQNGDYNFPGIGLPEDLKNKKRK
jgi:hypothetical protein